MSHSLPNDSEQPNRPVENRLIPPPRPISSRIRAGLNRLTPRLGILPGLALNLGGILAAAALWSFLFPGETRSLGFTAVVLLLILANACIYMPPLLKKRRLLYVLKNGRIKTAQVINRRINLGAKFKNSSWDDVHIVLEGDTIVYTTHDHDIADILPRGDINVLYHEKYPELLLPLPVLRLIAGSEIEELEEVANRETAAYEPLPQKSGMGSELTAAEFPVSHPAEIQEA